MAYKFYYRNNKSGATVMSHVALDRDDLTLINKVEAPTVKTTQMQTKKTTTKPVVEKKATKAKAEEKVEEVAEEKVEAKK